MEFVLAGRYEAEQPGDQRPFVDEFLGRDVRLDRPVVLQILHLPQLGTTAGQQAFEAHLRQVAAVDDAGVARVYDWGRDQDRSFVIREPVGGEELGAMLRRRGPLPAREVAGMGADVAAALAAAHRVGVTHGCLDPRAVLAGPHGVKVTGFGLAPWTWPATPGVETIPEVGTGVGTGAGVVSTYLAPEVRAGGRGDARSDLYGLGAVLYALLVGFPPPDARVGTPLDALAPSRAEPANVIPPQLDQLVARLLAGNPAQRYQTATQLQADLLRIAAVQSQDQSQGYGQALAPTAMGADRPGQRAAVVVALSVIILVAFLTVGLVVWALSRPSAAAAPATTAVPVTTAAPVTTAVPTTAVPTTAVPTTAVPTTATPTTATPPTTAVPLTTAVPTTS